MTKFKKYTSIYNSNYKEGVLMSTFKKILVVEDEKGIRENYVEEFEFNGYEVLSASNPEEGLRIYKKEWEDIGLVISDWNMPKMNGGEMFLQMKKVNPLIKIIFASNKSWTKEEMAIRDQAIFFTENKWDFDTLLEVIENNI